MGLGKRPPGGRKKPEAGGDSKVGALKGEVGHDEAKMWLRRVSQRSVTLIPPGIWLQGWLPQLLEATMASGLAQLGPGKEATGKPKKKPEANGDSEIGTLKAEVGHEELVVGKFR